MGSKAIIFKTIHLNNLSILNLKMKIFFALALVIVFPRDVVLDADCDSGDTVPEISDDCLSEFNNAVVNGNMAPFQLYKSFTKPVVQPAISNTKPDCPSS